MGIWLFMAGRSNEIATQFHQRSTGCPSAILSRKWGGVKTVWRLAAISRISPISRFRLCNRTCGKL